MAEISDPANALYYLDQFGLRLKPHIVLLGITLGNDISQAYLALDPHGRLYSHPGGWQGSSREYSQASRSALNNWHPIKSRQNIWYLRAPGNASSGRSAGGQKGGAYCGVSIRNRRRSPPGATGSTRVFSTMTDGLGMFTNPPPPEIVEAYARLCRCLEAFSLICRQHHIIFAVQIFPQRYQVQPGDWDKAVAQYGLKKSRFDLMAPNRRIGACCREHGIECIDPTAAMAQWYAKTRQNMYYPRGDMHLNRMGHSRLFCLFPAGLFTIGPGRSQAGRGG